MIKEVMTERARKYGNILSQSSVWGHWPVLAVKLPATPTQLQLEKTWRDMHTNSRAHMTMYSRIHTHSTYWHTVSSPYTGRRHWYTILYTERHDNNMIKLPATMDFNTIALFYMCFTGRSVTHCVFSWTSRTGAASKAGRNIRDAVLSTYRIPVTRRTKTFRVAACEHWVFIIRYRIHTGRGESTNKKQQFITIC